MHLREGLHHCYARFLGKDCDRDQAGRLGIRGGIRGNGKNYVSHGRQHRQLKTGEYRKMNGRHGGVKLRNAAPSNLWWGALVVFGMSIRLECATRDYKDLQAVQFPKGFQCSNEVGRLAKQPQLRQCEKGGQREAVSDIV
jgi:hypothetical protein